MLPRTGGQLQWPKLAWNWMRSPTFDPLAMTSTNRSVLAFNLSFLFSKKERFFPIVDRLLGWLAEGKLKIPPVTTYPLEQVGEAHAAIESGQTIGKLVLTTS